MIPHIIGIAGGFGHGKDEVGKVLVEEFGYVRRAFGECLKKEVHQALNGFVAFDPIYGRNEMPTACREALETCIGVGQLDPFVKPTTPEMRRLLQQYGTEFRRNQNLDYWVHCLADERPFPKRVVVTDVRFRNESDWVWRNSGEVWRVVRPVAQYSYGDARVTRHASEILLKDAPVDWIIDNSSTLKDLRQQVRCRMLLHGSTVSSTKEPDLPAVQ